MDPNILGSIAGTLTTVAFVPQVVKTWRSRQTRDISLAMWSIFVAGVALWEVYGILIVSWPIIVTNLFTLALAGTVLIIKIGNRDNE